jgi:hypothetical protein
MFWLLIYCADCVKCQQCGHVENICSMKKRCNWPVGWPQTAAVYRYPTYTFVKGTHTHIHPCTQYTHAHIHACTRPSHTQKCTRKCPFYVNTHTQTTQAMHMHVHMHAHTYTHIYMNAHITHMRTHSHHRHVRTHTHIHTYARTRAHHIYANMQITQAMHTHMHTYTRTHTRMLTTHAHLHMHTYTYARTHEHHIYTHTPICKPHKLCTFTHTCTRTHINTRMLTTYAHLHLHVCTHIHTHTFTHAHTHLPCWYLCGRPNRLDSQLCLWEQSNMQQNGTCLNAHDWDTNHTPCEYKFLLAPIFLMFSLYSLHNCGSHYTELSGSTHCT